ncbi:hypothetical protein D9613_001243 [Agrocybe pediades]|uniref:BTB domain-containing protein n=1 Tax=Agrocybe pediades TaxID=84607 RepID=A0A8H4R3G5_9AGAR|nr:hypothetical protein D9613_001243 [Agrocybe pediades]
MDVENINTLSELSSTQTTVFYPGFDIDVHPVSFSVEGRGFKINAAQLMSHSEFFRNMLNEAQRNGPLGSPGEGSAHSPIVVEGCTKDQFTSFMLWLNHSAWDASGISDAQGYLDILHVAHMWEIKSAFGFAIKELSSDKLPKALRPAHKIYLARRYGIVEWIPIPVRILLRTPLDCYTEEDHKHLGFSTVNLLAIAKEKIANIRRQLAHHTPYPSLRALEKAPHCSHQATCKKAWVDCWEKELSRQIHHPSEHFPLSRSIDTLRGMKHSGMHAECKKFVLNWMEKTCVGHTKEDRFIREVITAVEQEEYIRMF